MLGPGLIFRVFFILILIIKKNNYIFVETKLNNMDKYYTPSIEEFHVGFEYEVRDGVQFDHWYSQISDGTEIGLIKNDLEKELIRVKYLDKEDIESEGLKRIPIDYTWYKIEGTMMFKKDIHILILYDREIINKYNFKIDGLIYITKDDMHRTPNEDGSFKQSILFSGNIKNKSELKILLKQLNINN